MKMSPDMTEKNVSRHMTTDRGGLKDLLAYVLAYIMQRAETQPEQRPRQQQISKLHTVVIRNTTTEYTTCFSSYTRCWGCRPLRTTPVLKVFFPHVEIKLIIRPACPM